MAASDRDPQPIDPDVDLSVSSGKAAASGLEWDLLAAVAIGGVLGAEARYGLARALPHHVGAFPWSTVVINASGCALIGLLMAVLGERERTPRLARPFIGVGVLGGYTTFSTFAVDVELLLVTHREFVALAYVVTTVVTATLAVSGATRLAARTRLFR